MPSPRKKKAKRQADDSVHSGKGKKVRASAETATNAGGLVSLQLTTDGDDPHPRRSARPGAGMGGRNAQLEIISAVLEAPMRTSQPKGSTTLAPNVPTNPLAPIPPVGTMHR